MTKLSIMKKITTALIFVQLFLINTLSAADGGGDFLRSIGKIYVVVLVIAVIFIGLVFFLISLDKRLTNLENQINDHE